MADSMYCLSFPPLPHKNITGRGLQHSQQQLASQPPSSVMVGWQPMGSHLQEENPTYPSTLRLLPCRDLSPTPPLPLESAPQNAGPGGQSWPCGYIQMSALKGCPDVEQGTAERCSLPCHQRMLRNPRK